MTDPLFPASGPTPSAPGPRPRASEVPEELHPAQAFLLRLWTDYRTPVLAGLLMLLALALAISHYGRTQRIRTQEAAIRLNAAATLYNRVVLDRGISREDAERSLRDAITYCDDVRDQYPGTPAAHLALYVKGSCHFERLYHYVGTGEQERSLEYLDQAIAAFREYGEEATGNHDRAKGLIAEASCYENRAFITNDSELMRTAITRLDEAARLGQGSYLEAQALISRARCLEGLGQRDEARLTYEQVIRQRASLAQQRAQGLFSLSTPGGYNDLAQRRLERIESGIDAEAVAAGARRPPATGDTASPDAES